ncbi:MAG: hypothetical protein PQJ49_06240 [Sphaerochaetaceae bacterium]|nr:hypothetical protein [Sphaerochaetaceae bacterium]
MEFTFDIQEQAKYWQSGTVTVEADSLEEAKRKVMTGDYEHHGNNEILLDTEELLEREIVEIYPPRTNEEMSNVELVNKIKQTIAEYGSFSTGEVEADCSPCIESRGNLVHLIEYFNVEAEVVVYHDEVEVDEYNINYSELERNTLLDIANLCDTYIEFSKDQ